MKIKIEPQQLKKIKSLPTFEAKCEYWKETFACSYFQAFTISKDEDFRLIDEADNGEESQILFRYEFERIIELEPKVLMTSTRKEMFADLDRTKTFELLKKQFIEELERLPHSWRKFGQYGFVSNNGLNELDDIIRAFRDCHDFKFIEPTILKNDIQSFIKGYKIKELLEDIKAYSKSEIVEQTKALTEEEPTTDNRIEVKVSMQVFAAIIYHFGISGEVFPLIFKKDKSFNANATAKYYREHFKVMSNGKEVTEQTFKNCFKNSSIETLTDSSVLRALAHFPFDKME